MPLITTPHDILSPITDWGATGELKDSGATHGTDTPNVPGSMLNKMKADIKQLHDLEAQRHIVVAHTGAYSFVDSDHGKLHHNTGFSGAIAAREWTLPTPSPGNHRFECYDAAGAGIKLRARTGHTIVCGSLSSTSAGYIETLAAQKSFLVVVAITNTLWLILPTADSLTPG